MYCIEWIQPTKVKELLVYGPHLTQQEVVRSCGPVSVNVA